VSVGGNLVVRGRPRDTGNARESLRRASMHHVAKGCLLAGTGIRHRLRWVIWFGARFGGALYIGPGSEGSRIVFRRL